MDDYNWIQFTVGIFLSIVGVIGAVLNITVLVTYYRFRSMGSPTALLLANLTVSDLGLILFNFSFSASSSFANRWLFGEMGCQCYGFFGFFFGSAHIGSLTLLALDRYRSSCRSSLIYHPRQDSQIYSRYYKFLAGVWTYGLFWATMPILGWARYGFEPSTTSCTIDWRTNDLNYKTFLLFYFTFGFVVPFIIIFFCYYFATKKMESTSNCLTRSPISDYWANTKNVTLMSFLVNVSFLVAWSPYAILCMWTVIGEPDSVPYWFTLMPPLCAKASTILNPVIYYSFNPNLKAAMIAVLRGKDLPQEVAYSTEVQITDMEEINL